jgi:hypothetical protein
MKKPYKVTVIGPKQTWTRRAYDGIIDTTSKAKGLWSSELSPFNLGPCKLYGKYTAKVMENAWQYCKVYPKFVHKDKISKKYYEWAQEGWHNPRAVRYPMGKGRKPLFALWNGERLDYVSSRKKIYFKLYATAVLQTNAFRKLRKLHRKQNIVLWDYDGYDHRELNMTLTDVLNNPYKIMGHAFVLAILLEMEDRKIEGKVAQKKHCFYCKDKPGSFEPVIFYLKSLRVACPNCEPLIRETKGSHIRRE